MVNFDCSKEEMDLIGKIVERLNQHRISLKIKPLDVTATQMNITACHCNGCPLKLEELLNANTFSLAHDVLGINENISTRTGAIKGLFRPRFAA